MTELLGDLQGRETINDDILIYSSSKEEHDVRIDAVLQTIYHSGLKLNRDMCKFYKPEMEYFEHIGAKGILFKPSASRIKAIKEMSSPYRPTLQRVLGIKNYLGRFLPNLVTVIRPVTDLLTTYSAWAWDSAQEEAFKRVKELLTNRPILTFYDS